MESAKSRFLRYVTYYTTSDEFTGTSPSTERQKDLGRALMQELEALKLEDVHMDDCGNVLATLPASEGVDAPVIALIAHMDTAPDASGENVKPRLVRYEGGELKLNDAVSLTEALCPGLESHVGEELIVTDGTTLLGADDKAGVAEIMALVARIAADPSIPHPPLAVCFAPDEEIGHGCELLDLEKFGAEYAYTLDGDLIGGVEYECFNAASVTVTVRGHEIHPGSAKDIMINSLHVFEEFDAMLPAWQRPEHTCGYEGFFHLCDVSGTCVETTAHYIIRDHDAAEFDRKKQLVKDIADLMNKRWDEPRVTVEVRDQYRNMAEIVAPHQHLIDNAYKAFENVGVVAHTKPIRGGTDGAQLSFRGLPCPNLSTGGENYHSVREFAVVEQVEGMVDFLQELCKLYAQQA